MKATKVWVITGKSESGDDYGPDVFHKKPTAAAIKKWLVDQGSDGEQGGPASNGTWIHTTISESTLRP